MILPTPSLWNLSSTQNLRPKKFYTMQVHGSFSSLHVSLLPITSFLYYVHMTVLLLAIILLVMHACMLSGFSRVQLFVTLWTVADQAILSRGFSRKEYWSGLPCTSPGDLPNPGIEPTSLMSLALAGGFFTTSTIWEAPY